ncbi:ABC transporter ATP-binding protein [Bordetella sp. N]|uniref:ABC transporter ATP-binding protein n=1 Tax=Bordetella sp. N TaxID=1746199 RepID=UPI00070A115E|nr:ABC transporter ATP-binding protein [Bordetella sp. N]ALM85989.1 ABC transporter ATP-binding protein [Bordetella sp. N]
MPEHVHTRSVRLTIDHLHKKYGDMHALNDICLDVPPGAMLTLLGPSGCGKSTLLRSIAGFLGVSQGRVLIDGNDMNGVAPSHRQTAMVFQNYALFPHMSVVENVMFGLRMRKIPKPQARVRAGEALEMVRLSHLADRMPAQLSGGQQQRAALARALVTDPKVLLLDEPFGALDKSLREEMQVELRKLQKSVGVTTVCVTHDQQEAMAISDYIAVMNHGVLEQFGTPLEIYDAPTSHFVATFIGNSNVLPCKVVGGEGSVWRARLADGQEIAVQASREPSNEEGTHLAVRPSAIKVLSAREPSSAGASWSTQGKVSLCMNLGSSVIYEVETAGLGTLRVEQARRQADVLHAADDPVSLACDAQDFVLLRR